MELLAALLGAVVGAIVSFALAEYTKRRDERIKLLTALHAEIKLNLEAAAEVLKTNSTIDFDAKDDRRWAWCEAIPFSEAAWTAILSMGGLSYLDQVSVEPLARAFTLVKRANFAANKMQIGQYSPREGKEYTLRVRMAYEALAQALDLLEQKHFPKSLRPATQKSAKELTM